MSDLIDRQALLKRLKKHRYWWNIDEDYGIGDIIEQFPTVQPKRGKWIKEPYSEGLVTYRCSECMKAMGLGSNKSKWYKFCPNCGADMRGKEK